MSDCLNCQSKHTEPLFEVEDIFLDTYEWHECKECGLQFIFPFPTKAQLSQAYDESYYGEGDKKFSPFIESLIDSFRTLNAKSFSKRIGRKGKVLDIGCGNGNFLKYFSKTGKFELFGVEPEGKSAQRAIQIEGLQLKVSMFKPGIYEAKTFDAISLIHVFEHLPEPQEVIKEITRLIKDGGHLLIEVPNPKSWQASIFRNHWLHLDPPRHLHLYSPGLIEQELKKHNWKLEKRKYFSIQYNPFGFQQSILNLFVSRRDLLYESLKGNSKYIEGYPKSLLLIQKVMFIITFPCFILADFVASIFRRSATVKMIFRKS